MPSNKEFIEHIQQRILRSDHEFALDGYAGSIDRLQKAFPRYGSFLMEFIQNADDAGSSTMKIELFPDALQIANDGQPFSEADVKSICKVGRSSKTVKDSIGYLGVGFKAVFLISKQPEIYSGNWHFKFDKEQWPDSKMPWQIIPLWLDTPPAHPEIGFTTLFRLPLTPGDREKVKPELRREHLNSRILLFLNNLKEIKTQDQHCPQRRIEKTVLSESAEYCLIILREYENSRLQQEDRWLLFRTPYDVPADLKNDPVTIDWERNEVERREVGLAFKLDAQDNLIKEAKGTAHIGVFSFLPLKEIPSGLPFLLQADFLTMTGRGELARECAWNDWLTQKLYQLVIEKAIPAFCRHPQWKFQFTDCLYSSTGGHELFERHLKKPLRHYLTEQTVLVAEDGSLAKADQVVLLDEEMRAFLDRKDLEKVHPNKKGKALERLQEKGLLDFPLLFVSEEFAKNSSESRIQLWQQFFKSLGVDKKLSEKCFKKNVVQRIGILLALKYEESKGRKATEIPRSREVFGYDLAIEEELDEGQGFVQSPERYIEVKSSEKPYPDIYLTTRQFRTLQEKREKYYVYVVADALRNPALHVTRGDKLLTITQIRTMIPFRRWWDKAKEEEFRC